MVDVARMYKHSHIKIYIKIFKINYYFFLYQGLATLILAKINIEKIFQFLKLCIAIKT